MKIRELKPNELKLNFSQNRVHFNEEENILDTTELIYGQERGIKAFEFGLDINQKGYNIYFDGPTGVGKTMYVKRYLTRRAKEQIVPSDYCYVYNFISPDEPIAIELPAGCGKTFKDDMEEYVKYVKTNLKSTFSDQDLDKQRKEFKQKLEKEKKNIIFELNKETEKEGFSISQSANGVYMLPIKNGIILQKEEYDKLDEKEKIEYEKKSPQIQEKIFEALTKIREAELKNSKELENWQKQIAESAINVATVYLEKKYKKVEEIEKYLQEIKKDILKNLEEFLKPEDKKTNIPNAVQVKKPWENYEVNVFVDNSNTKGAPVIMDLDYSFDNIFGKIEYENVYGAIKTDYTKIKAGLLHKANGGYIVFQAKELLSTPFAYETLKKVLKIAEIGIEQTPEYKNPMMLESIKPKAIDLNVKVIIIGSSDIYNLLIAKDIDFPKLFKIKTEFDTDAPLNLENLEKLFKFISSYTIQEGLLKPDDTAVAKMVEYASKLSGKQDKLSTNFAEIGRLLLEASTWAKNDKKSMITEEYVYKAIEERKNRSKKYDQKMNEMIEENVLRIDTEGSKVGEINGLSVTSFSDSSFGKPVKITANTYAGEKGFVNIEREVKMSGPSHSKGVMIITGYLGEKYAQNFPLAVTGSITFEQLYGGIDGDSASSTEIYALISSLSEIPIKQNLAVTGSVNQKGDIQPIGGVNEKIEGFYEVCKRKGLTGDQGVLIPEQNVKNLHLSREVIEAVKKNKFHIYPVSKIDQGIEILTGVPAGKLQNGSYPNGTINYLVEQKLKKYYNIANNNK